MSQASKIVAAVSNRFRDSDIRADNRTMIAEFDAAFAAKDAEIAALKARAEKQSSEGFKLSKAWADAVDENKRLLEQLTRCQEASTAELLKHREERDRLKSALKLIRAEFRACSAHSVRSDNLLLYGSLQRCDLIAERALGEVE